VVAAALRARDLLILREDELLELILAAFADEFVHRHGRRSLLRIDRRWTTTERPGRHGASGQTAMQIDCQPMGLRTISLPSCVVLIAASCAAPVTTAPAVPAPTPSPPVPMATVSAPAPQASGPAPGASAAPPLVEPVPLAAPGCTFEASGGVLNGRLVLQLDGHRIGELEGEIKSVRAQVSRDATRATVQVVTKDLELQADAHPPSLELALTAAAAPVDEWIEPTTARVSRCGDGKATLRFRLPSSVIPSASASPAEVDIRQLSLVRTDRHPDGKMELLKAGARSPLRVSPAGRVVAEVRGPDPAPPDRPMPLTSATVFERKGSLARVLLEGDESNVVGWVNVSALESAGSMFGMLGALGGAGEAQRLVCPDGAKLLARAGNGVWHVGSIRPAGEVSVLPGRDGTFVVVLEADSIFGGLGLGEPTRGARRPAGELFLPREEAQRCAVKAPAKPKKP